MLRVLLTALLTAACLPEEVVITPTRIDRVTCTTRWAACIASQDENDDGIENAEESWTGMCTAIDECTACSGRCATLVFLDQPTSIPIGEPLGALTIELQDPTGAPIDNASGDVAIALDEPPAQVDAFGNLLAALDQGRAEFANVRISRVASDLQLRATWEGAEPAVSESFSSTPSCTEVSAYWPLNETTGTTFHDAAGAADASCTTCPTWDAGESAWLFDRSAGQGIDVPGGNDAPFHWSATDNLAVELWLHATADTCTVDTEVAVGRVGGTDPQRWWLGCLSTSQRFASSWQDVGGESIGLEGPAVDTRWHHVVLQRRVSPPRRELVVDGSLVAAASAPLGAFDQPVDPSLNLGWLDLTGDYHFDGYMGHIALYRRSLSRSEIMVHRSLGRAAGYCDVIPPACGDGRLDPGESCDDGNIAADDGCSPRCVRESRNCPADLVSYWRLEGLGLERFDDDISGNHLDCSFYSPAHDGPRCPDATAGIIDGAQQFDGNTTGLEVTLPAAAAFDWGPLDSFSVEAWMRPAQGSTCAGNQVVIGRRQGTPSAYWWLGCAGADGAARIDIRDADGTANTTLTGPVVTDDAWHHLAFTVDAVADTVTLFVDGEHAETIGIPFTSGFAMADPIEVGLFNGNYNFNGAIDAVAIYGRALHLAEVADHWALGAGSDICTR